MATPWEMDRDRIGWWVAAFALAAGVAYLIYSFIGTFVFGVFIYYATRPVYRRLKRVVRPPSLAAGIALLALALPAILLLAYTLAVGLQELDRFVEMRGLQAGQLEQMLTPYIDISQVVSDPQSILSHPNTFEALRQTMDEAGRYLGFIGSAALHLFVMILIAFYLLRDDQRLSEWFRRRFADTEGVMIEYARRVDRDFSNIFFGNLLNAVLTGIIGAISYGVMDYISPAGVGIPYPTLLGLLTGIASLVPVVGIKLVYVPLAGYLGYQVLNHTSLLWFPVLFVVVSFVIVDVIPDLVLRPYVSGRNLHLGMVMLAYIFGPLLFGWYGLFLGPMLLVLLVHFAALVLPELIAGAPIEPEAVGESILTGESRSDATTADAFEWGESARGAAEDDETIPGDPDTETGEGSSGDQPGE
ncbi:MAG: AI-2E family transporter [Halodesulfurarchaeum sp.]